MHFFNLSIFYNLYTFLNLINFQVAVFYSYMPENPDFVRSDTTLMSNVRRLLTGFKQSNVPYLGDPTETSYTVEFE